MVDWDKFFEGLFKGLSAYGVDPVLALAFLALLVAALLVSTMGLALWCVLAAIRRLSAPTSASPTQPVDARHVIDILNVLKWQDMQGKDADRLRQLEEHGADRRGGVLRHQQVQVRDDQGRVTRQDRLRGEQDVPVGRRSFRWHRRLG